MKLSSFRPLHVLLAGILTCVVVFSVQAKSKPEESLTPAVQSDSERGESTSLKKLNAEDYGQWESLAGRTRLAHDGRWLAYPIRRVNGENEVRLHMLATDAEEVLENASNPVFSADSQWLAFSIGLPPDEREKLEKEKKPIQNKLGLRSLVDGNTVEFEKIQSFSFSEDGKFLVMQTYPPKGRKSQGKDIMVRDLKKSLNTGFGNIASARWNDKVSLLAMIVDAEDQAGNGVQLYDPQEGKLVTLDSDQADYKSVTWRKDADDLAVFKESKYEDDEDTTRQVLTWRRLNHKKSSRKVFDHLNRDDFPSEFRVVDFEGLNWSDDGKRVFFGIQAWETKPKELTEDEEEEEAAESQEETAPESDVEGSTEETASEESGTETETETEAGSESDSETKPPSKSSREKETEGTSEESKDEQDSENETERKHEKKDSKKKDKPKSLRDTLKDPAGVEVWHSKDIEIIPLQKKTESRDRKKNFLAAWIIPENRFVQLGNEVTEDVTLLEAQKLALGTDNTPYETEKRFGPTLVDAYVINTASGKRWRAFEETKYHFSSSPEGRYIPYILADHFWLYDTKLKEATNITEDVDTSFINKERNTLTDQSAPYGICGWSKDGKHLFLYDRFDIWRFAPEDSKVECLTRGAADGIRYRRVIFDPDEDRFIDDSKPLYLSMYSEKTKQSGYAKMEWGELPENLVWKDKSVGSLIKAKDADVYAYQEGDYDDSPDAFVGNLDRRNMRQISKTNPFQSEFFWGRSELVDYTNDHGKALQGALFYPANYQPGKQYPMIVYIYETRSQTVHSYITPSERHPYNTAVFSAEGYFVFQPDIVYRAQNPGLSAKECVIPAVKSVLQTGMVDPKRIGLVGHSWGGYQTAFLSTQTDLFAALVAGAPLTNMMSMSMSIYWNSGQTDAWIFHESQGRMDRPFWRDVDTYMANSAIFNIENLNKPLLVAFGDEDGAVDWQQGIEMYNAARLAQKPMVMLVYPGENHGLAKKPNQVDYHYRILEWFGHYLKGEEAPPWILEGQTYLDRQKEIKAFKKKPAEDKKK